MSLEEREHVEHLREFIDMLSRQVYPEKPSLLHSDITARAIETLLNICPLRHGARVLDVGCGQGPALDTFSQQGLVPVGVTLSDEDVEVCREKGLAVACMDQSFLNFEPETFDLVWARHVIEHSIFPLFTLAGFYRVLRTGGFLYLEVPAPDTSCHHETNPNHYSVLTKSSWQTHLRRSGFEIIREENYAFEVSIGPDEYWGFYCRKKPLL